MLTEGASYLVAVTAIITVVVLAIVLQFYGSLRRDSATDNDADEDGLPLLERVEVSNASSGVPSISDISWSNVLTVFINGEKVILKNPDPQTLLVTFIRENRGLKGTKLGCEEGGCGACTVILTKNDETDGRASEVLSVNSCLRLLCLNDGMAIRTVEGIGSVKNDDMSEEQKRLVANNGTQCGFCSPGWVSNMHALRLSAEAKGISLSAKQIDQYLDGNMCRCTGYKPIVKAFQSFSHENASPPCSTSCGGCSTGGMVDLEDSINTACCKGAGSGSSSGGGCSSTNKGGCSGATATTSASLLRSKKDQKLVKSYRDATSPTPLMFYNEETGKRFLRPVGLQQLCTVLREYMFISVAPSTGIQSLYQPSSVQIVGGNTSIGVTKYLNGSAPYNACDDYDVYVDVNCVPEMVACVTSGGESDGGRLNKSSSTAGPHAYASPSATPLTLTVGAATSISALIALLRRHRCGGCTSPCGDEEVNHHSVFDVTANHLSKIANTQVRNAGSWAGNVMMFLRHNTFPSDAVLALTTAKAVLLVCTPLGETFSMGMEEFIEGSWDQWQRYGWFLLSMSIQDTDPSPTRTVGGVYTTVMETFKVAQRAANAHAYVNAGFLFQVLQMPNQPPVCASARVVYGGVGSRTFIARRTENALTNATIDRLTLTHALRALDQDLQEMGLTADFPKKNPFRVTVMHGDLYRALLRCFPISALPPNVASAVLPWVKPASRLTEVNLPPSPTQNMGPVGQPVGKLEGPIQVTGEAVYPSDEVAADPQGQGGLFACIVYSTTCAATFVAIDFSQSRALAGFVDCFTAADIPGKNAATPDAPLLLALGKTVHCVGQPLAVVVAISDALAQQAAKLVQVTYGQSSVPITTLDQAIAAKSFYPGRGNGFSYIKLGDPDSALAASAGTASGHVAAGGQYHFYMETQTATASLRDGDCLTVVCGTQDAVGYKATIAAALGIDPLKVTVQCPRTGGSFGGKITKGLPTAFLASLCAYRLGRPVRLFNSRTADMNLQSGREGWAFDYQVGFTKDGLITALKYEVYVDAGCTSEDTWGSLYMGMNWADNAYYLPNYQADAHMCFTNTPGRTSCRAPGVAQSCLATELVVDRVAAELNLPREVVQARNFIQTGQMCIAGQAVTQADRLQVCWDTLLQRSHYSQRLALVQTYNANNLWRKRGLAICPVKYGIGWAGYNAGCRLSVDKASGTALLKHSGREIGQGINTKVAQAVAYALGISLSLVRVECADSNDVANGGVTGGSGTSEVMVQAALNACATLNTRLDPYTGEGSTTRKAQSGVVDLLANARAGNRTVCARSTKDWTTLLGSLPSDVSLNTEGWFSPQSDGGVWRYFVYAACVTEIELDVLSGEVQVKGCEVVYDCGQSLNPSVDLGQVEGALIMGLGYFLQESVEYSDQAVLLSSGSWEYKPPMVQDIPTNLSVTFLKNDSNDLGVLGSKAVGEPPFIISNSIYFALRMAVSSARADAAVAAGKRSDSSGIRTFDLDVPATVDKRLAASQVHSSRFVMPT